MIADATVARRVLRHFALSGSIERCVPLDGGHINASFRVATLDRGAAAAAGDQFVLQRINPAVFPDAAAVMHNVGQVTRHVAAHLRRDDPAGWRRRVLQLVPTTDGADWYRAADASAWRLYRFIPDACTRHHATSPADAEAAARAFGDFLRQIADYKGPALRETIPGFHDTAARFDALARAADVDPAGRAAGCRTEIATALVQRPLATVLPPLLADGSVPVRVVHNDAKIANVLFDAGTGAALCVVDLDTVMPGSAIYDFGDLVRSLASPTAEDEPDVTRVAADSSVFAALTRGYLAGCGGLLTAGERSLLVFAGRLMALEQAVRFLTDHLEGDRYYRVNHPGHNLQRCRTQLQLLESLTQQEGELDRIVAAHHG